MLFIDSTLADINAQQLITVLLNGPLVFAQAGEENNPPVFDDESLPPSVYLA